MLFKHSVIALAMLITTSSISMVNATSEPDSAPDLAELTRRLKDSDAWVNAVWRRVEEYDRALSGLDSRPDGPIKARYHDQIIATKQGTLKLLEIDSPNNEVFEYYFARYLSFGKSLHPKYSPFIDHMKVYYQALMTLEELRTIASYDSDSLTALIQSNIPKELLTLFIENAKQAERTCMKGYNSFSSLGSSIPRDRFFARLTDIMSNKPIAEDVGPHTKLSLLRQYILALINLCYELSITTDTRDSRFTDNYLITLRNFKQLVAEEPEAWKELRNYEATYAKALDGLSMVEIFHDGDFSALTFTFGDLLKLA